MLLEVPWHIPSAEALTWASNSNTVKLHLVVVKAGVVTVS